MTTPAPTTHPPTSPQAAPPKAETVVVCLGLNSMKIMKKIFAGYMFATWCHSASAFTHSFAGAWDWNNAPSTRTFPIELAQRGNKIQGQYCAVAQNGNKTDCDDEKNPNITGSISADGQSATIRFSSFFGATNGKAQLRVLDGHLLWHITKSPDGGEFYAPGDAVLDRH